jgi:hypothetical protein
LRQGWRRQRQRQRKKNISHAPLLYVAAAEISYWAQVGAVLPLGIVMYRDRRIRALDRSAGLGLMAVWRAIIDHRRIRRQDAGKFFALWGLINDAMIPLLFASVSALCGAAACWLVASQNHRLILAPLANLTASVYMFWYYDM